MTQIEERRAMPGRTHRVVDSDSVRTNSRQLRDFVVPAVVIGAIGVVLAVVLWTAQSGVVDDAKLRNPAHPTAGPLHPLWNVSDWPFIFSLIFVGVAAALLFAFAWLSIRDRRVHHGLIVLAAVTILSGLDPFANWVTFTTFNPTFLHFPTSWAWISLAPLIEPVTNVPGYPMYYLGVALVAFALATYTRGRVNPDRWLGRHPLLTFFGVGLVVGVIWDILTELFMMRAGMYFYSQSYGPNIHWGPVSYPVYWGFFTWSSIAVITVLLYRDDDGISVLHRFGRHLPGPETTPDSVSVLRRIIAGVLILCASYAFCFALYGGFRIGHLDHAGYTGPWPYPSTKVYDPQGVLQHAGQVGPYYK